MVEGPGAEYAEVQRRRHRANVSRAGSLLATLLVPYLGIRLANSPNPTYTVHACILAAHWGPVGVWERGGRGCSGPRGA